MMNESILLEGFLKFIGDKSYFVEEDGTVWKNAFMNGTKVDAVSEYLQAKAINKWEDSSNPLPGSGSKQNEDWFRKSLLAFGNHRNYWCTECGSHVTEGHGEKCPLIIHALEIYDRDWIEKNIQVKEWDNYGYIISGSKLNTNLK